jgi:hypothetical protein
LKVSTRRLFFRDPSSAEFSHLTPKGTAAEDREFMPQHDDFEVPIGRTNAQDRELKRPASTRCLSFSSQTSSAPR